MNNEISELNLSRLRNEEHFGFHSEFTKLANECSLSETFVGLLQVYEKHYDELNASLEVVRKSVLTGQLEEADIRRNGIFRSLQAATRGYLRHPDLEKQLSARRLCNIIRHYGRNVMSGTRENRTYAITNMLRDLRATPATDLQLPGLTNWVSELETANQACKNVKESRYEEWEKRPDQKVLDARQLLDADYKVIVKYLEAHGVLHSDEENYRQLVIALNDRVAFYKRLIAQRRGIMAAKREQGTESSSSYSSSSVAVAG
ncbi:MAG: DUF6261 family protein [Puniceicoccales bacterium]|jgi:hypothetical protein|nr:DUF6261 family protein [Puniceicoccales bacterium]